MRGRGQRGSVLILMPAAVLVLVILGAISVDFSVAYLAQRELKDTAVAAANDAAGAGLDEARFRTGDGTVALDPATATEVAVRAATASVSGPVRLTAAPVVVVDDRRVTVTLEGDAPYVFSGGVPGAPKRVRVRARASAVLQTP
jgi:Flp pilus assembly protein TadG